MAPNKHRFGWTKFYEAIADKLLTYRNDRGALVEGIREISVRVDGLGHLAEDKYADGTTGFVKDIWSKRVLSIQQWWRTSSIGSAN